MLTPPGAIDLAASRVIKGVQAIERRAGGVASLDLHTFVQAHHGELLRRAYLLTGSRADAEDLVQEALARAWLASRGQPVERPRAYVHRALLNLYLSRWRRLRIVRETPAAEVPEGGIPDPAGEVAEREAIWAVLRRLPPRQRAVLVLRFYEDLSETQAAEVLGVSVGTVRSQCWRALRRVQRELEEGRDG